MTFRKFLMTPAPLRAVCLLLVLGSGAGCDSKTPQDAAPSQTSPALPVVSEGESAETSPARMVTADEMRKLLGASGESRFERAGRSFIEAYLGNSGATTLVPLRGQPLKLLDISQTRINDLSPLVGMPIRRLYLIRSRVRDLAPLRGMPLELLEMFECEVSDLSPLAGAPLTMLEASRTKVSDLTPLASTPQLSELYLEGALVQDVAPLQGLPLQRLWLNGCPVSDLSPLAGKQLLELNLCETNITSLETVATMQVGTLWLRQTSIEDLSPLVSSTLVSLDLQETGVRDLAPLSGMLTLKRLNIAGTEVTDLTPLASLSLERLIFSPERITTGLEILRNMSSLTQLDTSFDGPGEPLSPAEFWKRYDRGDFSREKSPP